MQLEHERSGGVINAPAQAQICLNDEKLASMLNRCQHIGAVSRGIFASLLKENEILPPALSLKPTASSSASGNFRTYG